jgi:predicted lysophospholipase L1 biosynthesis ABC-type transport system permease subunit
MEGREATAGVVVAALAVAAAMVEAMGVVVMGALVVGTVVVVVVATALHPTPHLRLPQQGLCLGMGHLQPHTTGTVTVTGETRYSVTPCAEITL